MTINIYRWDLENCIEAVEFYRSETEGTNTWKENGVSFIATLEKMKMMLKDDE